MRRIAMVIALGIGLITPAFAQKAGIEAVNAKWVEFFNKGEARGRFRRVAGRGYHPAAPARPAEIPSNQPNPE
jgi:hypothetical protein